ncbi:hypothetical protein FRC0190_00229 [Corynebacterium rouxii]|uniref:Uncharacterized protein n=1 Tax=Corynebacterium rouxii TaxID=2719119 RepID=A0A6I8MBJ3_9CORY|nr:hypothetical protein FRC0190_00229 [Corynebacterium rouxii]
MSTPVATSTAGPHREITTAHPAWELKESTITTRAAAILAGTSRTTLPPPH